MKIFKAVIMGCLVLGLSNCTSYDFTHTKIQQGNLLYDHAIARLKTGMSKDEVSAIMGSSLLTSTFSDNRWDYAYTERVGNGPSTKKYLTIYFSNDRVTSISHV